MTLLQVYSNWYQELAPLSALFGGDSERERANNSLHDYQKAQALDSVSIGQIKRWLLQLNFTRGQFVLVMKLILFDFL